VPRQFRFEGQTYSLPDGTSDQEALDFINSQHPAVTPGTESANLWHPTIFDRAMQPWNIENGLQQVDQFGNSLRDLFTGSGPLDERMGGVISNIPFIGGPLTESAHALARLNGTEPNPGYSAGCWLLMKSSAS